MGEKCSYGLARLIQIREEYCCCCICLWAWEQAQDEFSNHSKCSFGANEELDELITYRAFEHFPSEMEDATICQHDRHAQNIVLGNAILEAPWTTGITGNI